MPTLWRARGEFKPARIPLILKGGKGGDELLGGKKDDKLAGQKGPDEMDGGKGDDTCKGGPGRGLGEELREGQERLRP